MGDAARRCVLSKFTWPQVVERCLVIYCGGCHLGSGATLPAECN
jgi:hypothetical protein